MNVIPRIQYTHFSNPGPSGHFNECLFPTINSPIFYGYHDPPKPTSEAMISATPLHDDVIKWNHFPRYWPFVRGIHRSPVNSPHKGQWRRALMFSLICARINGSVKNREAGDLRCHRAHYDVTIMFQLLFDTRVPAACVNGGCESAANATCYQW